MTGRIGYPDTRHFSARIRLFVIVFQRYLVCATALIWTACGSNPGNPGNPDAAAIDIVESADSSSDDTPDHGPNSDVDATCGRNAPLCAQTCGGDAYYGEATCRDGRWFCEEGIVEDDCPSGTCWGAPMPGEVCAGGYQCRPWETGALDTCPEEEMLCADCRGFQPDPYVTDGCVCTCDRGVIRCAPLDDDCESTSVSTLDGVSLVIELEQCVYTQAELAAGVEFAWLVEITQAIERVQPRPQDGGQCGQPDASGLIPFVSFRSGDAEWCRCDEGLCMATSWQTDLAPGRHRGSITWDGVAWEGPSDTGNPSGQPFPPGRATIEVSYRGTDGDDAPFEVVATSTFEIIP